MFNPASLRMDRCRIRNLLNVTPVEQVQLALRRLQARSARTVPLALPPPQLTAPRARRRTVAHSAASVPVDVRADVPPAKLADEAKVAALQRLNCRFCKRCGSPMQLAVPPGEDDLRHVCGNCSFVDYHNPKMVVGCVIEHEGKVLLCKRALEPCAGLWTLPAGYMELGETCAEGAARETWEEAEARIHLDAPYAHLDIPVIGQTYMFFRGRLAEPYTYGAGPESEEVALFEAGEIPFAELAFSSVSLTLQQWVDDKAAGAYSRRHGVIRKKPGASYRDPDAFSFEDTFAV